MMHKSSRRGRSGQIIVVSALVIALIMISTATYIYELSGNMGGNDPYLLNEVISSIELGSKHVVISALANITNGGQNQTLTADLNEWKIVVERQYSFGKFTMGYAPRDTSPYSSGLYVSWGNNGSGVSEAYVDVQLNASGGETEMQRPFGVNVSTRLYIEGFMTENSPSSRQVTVVYELFNEGKPALAENVVFYYLQSSQWVEATNSLTVTDYGNGTYRATFNVETVASSLDISVRVSDLREILVQANATCLQQ